MGTIAGVNFNFILSLAQGWTAVLPVWVLSAGPVLGFVMGLLPGLYPAARAVAIEPVAALTQ